MRKLYNKQKIFSFTDQFSVYDDQERRQYYVKGSFMKIPKQFTIYNHHDQEIAVITKKIWSFLPKFYVDIHHQSQILIEKEITFLKARYHISAKGITVEGDWWDMTFNILHQGKPIAAIAKRWFSWGDTYRICGRENPLF